MQISRTAESKGKIWNWCWTCWSYLCGRG